MSMKNNALFKVYSKGSNSDLSRTVAECISLQRKVANFFKEAMQTVHIKCKCVQGNLDIETLNLVTICDLVTTILKRPFFNILHKIIRFSDIMRFSDSFCRNHKCH